MTSRMLSLSDSEIERVLFNNQELKNRFPFVKQAAAARAKVTGCRSCQKKALSSKYNAAVDQLRTHIAQLNNTDQAEFKRILGVDHVRFYRTVWRDGVQVREAIKF